MTSPCRIAFHLVLGEGWTGGLSYYENLFRALRTVISASDFTLIGFIQRPDPLYDHLLTYLDEVQVLSASSLFDRVSKKILSRLLYKVRSVVPYEPILSQQARRAKVDVLFVRGNIGPHFRIPTLCWFPDFQYLHDPEMFSPAETIALDAGVKSIASHASRVILSSNAVKQDFTKVEPQYAYKIRILPFVSYVDSSVYDQDPRWVCEKYHLPEKFFHLPNQFWKHKNHQIVLEALTLARRQNPDITIVSTGMLSDYRHPRFSSDFLADVSRSGNRENFILLGLVPRNHLYALMRQSLAVIQPSLFEGWSTIVEEVKSLGKSILLSDLPVHREQNPPSVEYFNPTDAISLTEKILRFYATRSPGPELRLEQLARQNFESRLRRFGETFLEIVAETTQ
jgi:glycosyltransferase involved in cell wall biosynthesis